MEVLRGAGNRHTLRIDCTDEFLDLNADLADALASLNNLHVITFLKIAELGHRVLWRTQSPVSSATINYTHAIRLGGSRLSFLPALVGFKDSLQKLELSVPPHFLPFLLTDIGVDIRFPRVHTLDLRISHLNFLLRDVTLAFPNLSHLSIRDDVMDPEMMKDARDLNVATTYQPWDILETLYCYSVVTVYSLAFKCRVRHWKNVYTMAWCSTGVHGGKMRYYSNRYGQE